MKNIAAFVSRYPHWLALLSGGMSATGFAPLNLWPLTLMCLALLMHLVASANSGKRAFLIGWLFGVGHFSIGNNWIATAFTYQAAMPAWLGWIAVVLLALYLAVYPALAAWGAWWIAKKPFPFRGGVGVGLVNQALRPDDNPHPSAASRLPPSPEGAGLSLPFILAFAGCWIITEWLRAWVFTGFAWNPLSVLMVSLGQLAGSATILGTYGVSGVILLLAGFIAFYVGSWIQKILSHWSDGSWITYLMLGLLFFCFASFLVFTQLEMMGRQPELLRGKGQQAQLTIVQPNISQTVKHVDGYEAVNFSRLAQHSRPIDDKPRLLLWPEAAIPWWLEDGYSPYAYRNQPGGSAAGTRALLARLLGPDDILLTGADRLVFDSNGAVIGAHNSVFAIDKSGAIRTTYDKAHLVPYGEYLALRWLLEPLGATRLVPGVLDFLHGPGPQTLNLGANRPKVGMQICYEIIFSGKVVDRANRPDFIFNPSNDAWFGSWGSPQFLAMSRLRAIEEGLPVVRATPTGISAVIDADGRVVESLPSHIAGRIDTVLPVAKAPTLFARFGNSLPLGFAALLIALAFIPLVRTRASR